VEGGVKGVEGRNGFGGRKGVNGGRTPSTPQRRCSSAFQPIGGRMEAEKENAVTFEAKRCYFWVETILLFSFRDNLRRFFKNYMYICRLNPLTEMT
jgi:hypothetical protein